MVEGISLDVIFYFQKEILILKYANSKGIPSKPKTLFWRQFNVFRMLYGRLIDVEITLENLLNFKTLFWRQFNVFWTLWMSNGRWKSTTPLLSVSIHSTLSHEFQKDFGINIRRHRIMWLHDNLIFQVIFLENEK